MRSELGQCLYISESGRGGGGVAGEGRGGAGGGGDCRHVFRCL